MESAAATAEPRPDALWMALRFDQRIALSETSGRTESLPADPALRFLQLTSKVSPEPPRGVLLEIGGSLRLFGGLSRIQEIVRACCAIAPSLPDPWCGIAPTPRAAWILAVARAQGIRLCHPVLERSTLRPCLEPLPIVCLLPDATERATLATLGVRTLGDLAALPTAGLRKRGLGRLLLRLQQALGEQPEPRHFLADPDAFHARHVLDPAEADARRVDQALEALIHRLTRFLFRLDRAIERMDIRLSHRHAPPTACSIGFLRPTRDPRWILSVTQEHLHRITIRQRVEAVELEVRGLTEWVPGDTGFPWADPHAGSSMRPLIERLRARMGPSSVCRLCERGHPLPEARSAMVPLTRFEPPSPSDAGICRERTLSAHSGSRPVWLLHEPRPLENRPGGLPCWGGILRLETGPERIEGGWWSGEDRAREYFVALAPSGARLWIFRSLRPPHSWYLHGLFS